MKSLLTLTLAAALGAGACGTSAPDTADVSLNSENGAEVGATAQRARARTAAPARPVYRDVTIPAGTTLPLTLTSSIASNTSVEDAVTAELTRAITKKVRLGPGADATTQLTAPLKVRVRVS